MSRSNAVTAPTHEEYKAMWLSMGGENAFKTIVSAAMLIHREEAIKYITECKDREMLALADEELMEHIKQSGELSEKKIKELEFVHFMAQPGVAEELLWGMKYIRGRNTVRGLSPKKAIEFLRGYKVDYILGEAYCPQEYRKEVS